MCGRYASSRKPDDLVSYFEVEEPPEEVLDPSWNVAPTDKVYAVVQRETRQLRVVRWGLVPSWATDPKVGSRFINARQETVATTPAFRSAYAKRRCLVPADGYYEWQQQGAAKQPWFLSLASGEPLAMAGVYEHWKAPDGTWLSTCAVLTTSAPDEVGEIHDRTPLLVPREGWALWLAPDVAAPEGLLVPGTSGVLDAWPVSTDVGNVRNDGAYLVEPLEG
jgi:putative SOS response-associated peptidase YedK